MESDVISLKKKHVHIPQLHYDWTIKEAGGRIILEITWQCEECKKRLYPKFEE